MTDAAGSGPPPPEQLRETLKEKTVPELIKKCKEAGISGYSNKRKEELIDLLVLKKPRLDKQVHHVGALDRTGLRSLRAVVFVFLFPTALSSYRDAREIMQVRPPAPQDSLGQQLLRAAQLEAAAKEESIGNEEASVRLRLLSVRAVKWCAMPMQRCLSMPLFPAFSPFVSLSIVGLAGSVRTRSCECDEPHRTLGQMMRTLRTRPTV
jgi:hypothetical protein